jgi:DNA-binding NarL/FixJ family response regulator
MTGKDRTVRLVAREILHWGWSELRDAAGTGLLVWRLREADASALGATGPSERPNDSEASEQQPSSGPVGTEAFPGATLSRQAEVTAEADGEPMLRLRLNHISSRERQVLEGLIDGKSNREIGLALKISARTVERHRANIMAKMEAASFSELLQMAFRLGIRGGANRSSGPPLFG